MNRYYARVIDDTPCPEDDSIGCEDCAGEAKCSILSHEAGCCIGKCSHPDCEEERGEDIN